VDDFFQWLPADYIGEAGESMGSVTRLAQLINGKWQMI